MQPQPDNTPVTDTAKRPLVIVVAEESVYDLVAADQSFDVFADRFQSYAAFLEAARARKVPLERSPVVVLCSDALPEDDAVSLSALVSMVRDVAVVVGWNGAEYNGVVGIRDAVTLNAVRQAIGTRIGMRFSPVADGDVALVAPTPLVVEAPAVDDQVIDLALEEIEEIEAIEAIEAIDAIDAIQEIGKVRAAPEVEALFAAEPLDAVVIDAVLGEDLALVATADDALAVEASAAVLEGSAPLRSARPAARPAAMKPVSRNDAPASPVREAATAGAQGFWSRWVPGADGTVAEEAEDFSDLAAALDEADADDISNWTPRALAATDMPEEITNSHQAIAPDARPFDLPPTEAELAGELFAAPPERDRLPVHQAQILAVYSPKGGVGKTSISVNLAARLAMRTKLQVCIVDLDLGFGNVGTRLGLFMPTVRELIAEGRIDNESVSRNLAYDPRTGVHALLAPLRPDARADARFMRPENFDQILRVLADRFDVIILDCPVELTDPIVSKVVMRRAHRIAMVLNNEQATLIDARRAIETMCRPADAVRGTGLGVKPEQIGIIVNQKVDGVGRDEIGVQSLLSGEDPSHPAHAVPVITSLKDDRVTWVRNANLGRPVATDGYTEIDTNLDCALASLLPGVAELLGMPTMVTVPGVEDVWAGTESAASGKRFALRKRS